MFQFASYKKSLRCNTVIYNIRANIDAAEGWYWLSAFIVVMEYKSLIATYFQFVCSIGLGKVYMKWLQHVSDFCNSFVQPFWEKCTYSIVFWKWEALLSAKFVHGPRAVVVYPGPGTYQSPALAGFACRDQDYYAGTPHTRNNHRSRVDIKVIFVWPAVLS